MVTFTVSEEKNKLAKILAKQFPKMSYSNIHKLLRLKDVKVNGIRTSENGDVFKGDEIIVYVTDEMLKGKPLKFDVIYEDDNIIVVDKPVGVEVESESYNDLTGAVGSYLREKKQNAYPVHRLDRNTHGLVVFAKTKEALSELLLAFKNRTIDRYYLAMVHGIPIRDVCHLVAYLYKDTIKKTSRISDDPLPGYEKIETKYKLIEKFNNHSLLEVELITGKMHQIRAHLAHVGYPLIGDGKYGKNSMNKSFQSDSQALVAYKLCFRFKENSILHYLDNKVIKLNSAVDFINKI